MASSFYGRCPDCGRSFSLLDLRIMAVGDGWDRHVVLDANRATGIATTSSFDELTFLGNGFDFAAHPDFSLSAVMRRREDGSFELLPREAKP